MGERNHLVKVGDFGELENVRESSREKDETLKKFPIEHPVEQPLIQSR